MAKQKSLKKKAASGMVWTSIQKFSKTGIQFISGIVLARLLTPFDYGCIGMLMVFITLSESFIDGGFGSALIQKKTLRRQGTMPCLRLRGNGGKELEAMVRQV